MPLIYIWHLHNGGLLQPVVLSESQRAERQSSVSRDKPDSASLSAAVLLIDRFISGLSLHRQSVCVFVCVLCDATIQRPTHRRKVQHAQVRKGERTPATS